MKLTVKYMKSIITTMLMLVILGACANNSKTLKHLLLAMIIPLFPWDF